MSHSLGFWKQRLAPSLCALVASAGAVSSADESPILAQPGNFVVTGAVAPIQPASHVASEDDPPPPPPFQLSPATGPSARRAPAGVTAPTQAPIPIVDVNEPPQLEASPTPAIIEIGPVPTEAEPAAPLAAPALDEAEPSPAPVASDDSITPIPLPTGDFADEQDAPATVKAAEDVPDVNISAPIPAEAPQSELVQERFPNGSLKIAREVTQDGQGNFINHGTWKEWNLQGELTAEGEYKMGVRHGTWRRMLRASESPLFASPPYNQFKGPFVSEASLEHGKLQGMWVISDGQGRKISEIAYVNGMRNGVSTWWHTNGRKMQQITFRDGVAVDEILTWRPDGSLEAKEVYQDGRKLETKTEFYAPNRRKSLGDYLSPRMLVTKEDDWWNCRLATFTAQGQADRHGPWTAWHQNGQVQVEGHFKFGQPEGEFTWFYSNGQKSAEGAYQNGERHGAWTWWHDNGLKSSTGEFIDGKPAGHWTWWNEDGKVAQKADFADGIPAQALEMPQQNKQPQPKQATAPSRYRYPQ